MAGTAAILALLAGVVLAVSQLLHPVDFGGQVGDAAAQAAGAGAGAGSGSVRLETPGYWSWALLDRHTGRLVGSTNLAATNTTESMVKAWIVADYLRRQAAQRRRPSDQMLQAASSAIRHSDDAAAQLLYVQSGGDEVIHRLVTTCRLTDTTAYPSWWSRTQMSARDAVRMGACIADGRAAGPQWTSWLLGEMRQVQGTTGRADQPAGGRWGIIDGLPAAVAGRVAVKNGWTPIWADGNWHLNCLAIADGWVLAVEARYPISLGLDHGAGICRTVAEQLRLG